MFPEIEYHTRLKRLQECLCKQEIALAILSDNVDLYYYSGSVKPLYALIPAEGEPVLLARKALEQIASEVPWAKLEFFNNSKELRQIIEKNQLQQAEKIGLPLDRIPYNTVLRWQQFFPQTEIVDLAWELRKLRMIKSSLEIEIQRRAGKVMSGVPKVVREAFYAGITELELSTALECYFRLNRHTGLVRCHREAVEMNYGICSGGVHSLAGTKFEGICSGLGLSPSVPYGATALPIHQGEAVVLDYAFNLEGYHVDQTRMFSWGEPDQKVYQAYQAMYLIEQELIKELKPGKSWGELYDLALQIAAQEGFATEFMGLSTDKVKFVGHGLGLELDEPPFLAIGMEELLAVGMVLALEPKVSLPGIGVVGIEDTLVITETGVESLTKCKTEMIIV